MGLIAKIIGWFVPDSGLDLAFLVSDVFKAHNFERVTSHLEPLRWDARLANLATILAKQETGIADISDIDLFGLMSSASYNAATGAMNYSSYKTSAKNAMRGWAESPVCLKKILGSYKDIGVGVYQDKEANIFWCVLFGTEEG